MLHRKQKQHCKGCIHYWTKGVTGNHCCLYGKDAKDAYGQCINTQSRRVDLPVKTDNEKVAK